MNLFVKNTLTLLVTFFLAGTGGVSISADTGGSASQERAGTDISDAECRHTLDLMFSGRPRDAADYIDARGDRYRSGPLYHLMRARVYREFLPVDDEQKDTVKALAEPIYADLDITIDECTRRLDAGEDNPHLLLYRGWAWMFKSHIRTFERSFWTAGRDAKKGKGDLVEYLSDHPDDPVANGIMGAFLYFADTLPAAFKFISRLLFMPTGDREQGLEMMVKSCRQSSLIEIDNKTLLYSVYMAFEGRYEDGLGGFERLHRRYPLYPAFVRPFVITLPFTPRDRDRTMSIVAGILQSDDLPPPERRDQGAFNMLRFSRAYADRFYDPAGAARQFEDIAGGGPTHPDWIVSYANYELARQLAARGNRDGARAHLEAVLDDPSGGYLHGEAHTMLDDLDDDYAPSALSGVDVSAIYTAPADTVAAIAGQLRATDTPGVQSIFYAGEAALMSGNEEDAIAEYEAVVARDAPVWDESFQLIACSRLAEINGARLQYDAAEHYLDMAPRFYHKEFLYDWLFEGRKRYYERVQSGEESGPPTLFSHIP